MKPLRRKRLEKLISECSIIKDLDVHITIVKCIVLFAEVIALPISYSILALPFDNVVRNNKTYDRTQEKWWMETVSLPGHRGVFLPSTAKNAAEEFSLFIAQKLRDNGCKCKYFNSMIPKVYILPRNLTSHCIPDLGSFMITDTLETKIDSYSSGV